MNEAYCKNEGATSIALKAPSNLVCTLRATRQDRFYHRNILPSNPPSRSQRCFRYLNCFNGAIRHSKYWCSSSGQQFVGELPSQSTVRLRSHVMQQAGPPFKAVYLSSQFDRKTDCFGKGAACLLRPVRENGASVISGPKGPDPFDADEFTSKDSRKPTCEQNRASFTKAVCGTQTRHGVSVNKYQADSQSVLMLVRIRDDVCRGICVAPHTFPLLSCAVADGRGTATNFKALGRKLE